ncbi:MAG TPA: glycogen debranching N-terminal domain-containing protein, partial [Ktedonobacterales bacterium]|nr:glycogen debranching N-terminal domain-containing protein [Ktedonobacterales bacterium]
MAQQTHTHSESERGSNHNDSQRSSESQSDHQPNNQSEGRQNADEPSHNLSHNLFPAGQPAWIRDIRDAIQAKHNQVFTLTDQGGDMSQDESAHGMYFHDTCYFDQVELRVNGQPLLPLLGSAAHGSLSEFVLSNHELRMSNGRTLSKDMLGIQRTRDLEGEITERFILWNRDRQDVVLDLSLTFGANFKSIMQIRGAQEGKRGTLRPPAYKHGTLRFVYDGADQHTRAASVSFSPTPDHTDGGCVTYRIRLQPQQRKILTLTYELEDKPPSGATSPTGKMHTPTGTSIPPSLESKLRSGGNPDRHKAFDRELSRLPRIETSNA